MSHSKALPRELTSYYFDPRGISANKSHEDVNNKNFLNHINDCQPAEEQVRLTESLATEVFAGKAKLRPFLPFWSSEDTSSVPGW